MTLNYSQIDKRMLTRIDINDLLENWTTSTENNPVSSKLSLIIRDESDVRVSALMVKISQHQLKMFWECFPGQTAFIRHYWITISIELQFLLDEES